MYIVIFLDLLRNLNKASTGRLSGCSKVTVQGDFHVGKSTLDISHLSNVLTSVLGRWMSVVSSVVHESASILQKEEECVGRPMGVWVPCTAGVELFPLCSLESCSPQQLQHHQTLLADKGCAWGRWWVLIFGKTEWRRYKLRITGWHHIWTPLPFKKRAKWPSWPHTNRFIPVPSTGSFQRLPLAHLPSSSTCMSLRDSGKN